MVGSRQDSHDLLMVCGPRSTSLGPNPRAATAEGEPRMAIAVRDSDSPDAYVEFYDRLTDCGTLT